MHRAILREKRLTRQQELLLLTDGDTLALSLSSDGRVLQQPAPKFAPADIPFTAESASTVPD